MKICHREATKLSLNTLELEAIMRQEPELTIILPSAIRIKPTSNGNVINSVTIDFSAIQSVDRIKPGI